jgi:iron complex transport system substrate-binding protein
MRKNIVLVLVLAGSVVFAGGSTESAGSKADGRNSGARSPKANTVTVGDALGRELTVIENPEHVICSGPGCLRLLTYLRCQDRIVAVDDMEGRRPKFDARPYAMANPQFKDLPVFGQFRGHDNPELIVALDPQPQVIFKTYSSMGVDPLELEQKTGIPVVALNYGDLFGYRDDFYASLRTMARAMDREERAEEVISFFEETIADLDKRTADIPEASKKTCFVGGIAYKGPHGFQSTEPTYPPFMFVNARNVAYDPSKGLEDLQHSDVAKEKIVAWDPDVLFVDVSTLQSDPQASAVYELENDPAYTGLTAVKAGEVYGLLPYNWYTENYGSILADAYFVGTVLYPERFSDVEPAGKADEIYRFLVGDAVFDQLNEAFQGLGFERIHLKGSE